MNRWLLSVYWLVLTCWVSLLAAAGVAATGVFTTLPHLGLEVQEYREYLGSDTVAHGRMAGGRVMEPIFAASDLGQAALAAIALVLLLVQIWSQRRPVGALEWARRALLAFAIALVAWNTFIAAPPMNASLRELWAAAASNDRARAESAQAAFNEGHHMASTLAKIRLAALLGCVALSAVTLTRRDGEPPA